MSDIQILVINTDLKRRELLLQQFTELKIPYPITYVKTYIPGNSKDYLPEPKAIGKSPTMKELCCARSHFSAIEVAAADTSPTYSVILEDDVALHRTLFVPYLTYLKEHWKNFSEEDVMVSLGWISPIVYTQLRQMLGKTYKGWPVLIGNIQACGLQAYMIHRDTAKKLVPIVVHKTFEDFSKALESLKIPFIRKGEGIVDLIMPYLLRQHCVFPILAIEQKVESSLGHDNETFYWTPFFKGNEHLRTNYWSDDVAEAEAEEDL